MKKLSSIIFSFLLINSLFAQTVDSIIDIRDNQVYKVVKIGQQWWMQENMNIGIQINGSQNASDNGIIEKYCYGDNANNCNIFGGLYQWNEMMDYNLSEDGNPGTIRGICSSGWHLPTDNEWNELTYLLGGESIAGGMLKETGTIHWSDPNTGATNWSGFTALPGGYRRMEGYFDQISIQAVFWSSTEYGGDDAWGRNVVYNAINTGHASGSKGNGYSVRCIIDTDQFSYLKISDKNLRAISKLDFTYPRAIDTIIIINSGAGSTINVTSIHTNTSAYNLTKSSAVLSSGDSIHLTITFNSPIDEIYYFDTLNIESDDPYNPVIYVPLTGYKPKTDSIIDIRDNQVYKVLKIGQQWWMQENLNIGMRINDTQDAADNGIIEKYCYGNNKKNCDIYGGLYMWNETRDYNPSDNGNPGITLGICPIGWHLPTDAEWTELTDFLGGESVAGGKLKETGTTHWLYPNTGATNKTGFTALSGGYRSNGGSFGWFGYNGYWWSATECDATTAWARYMVCDHANVGRYGGYNWFGFSVRCLRDSSQFGYLTITDNNFESVSALNFDNSNNREELIIINSGTEQTINISSIYKKNSAYSLNKSASILLPGDSIHLSVTFNPPVKGMYSDTIYIESDDPYKSLIAIPLFGTFPLEISITDSSNISCFGYSDGSATVTPSLGTPPYQYHWDDPGITTDSTITGLSPNIFYHVSVTDSKGNIVTDSIILSEPEELSILATITDVSVTGGNDGIIDVSVSGGIQPYSYNWSNDSTTEDLSGILTGAYRLIVEDQNGCIKKDTFRVKEPIHLQFEKVDVSCYGGNDGKIDMTILGGNPPYSINWSNNVKTEYIENLQNGRYIVIITDNFGVFVTDTVEISEPDPLSILSDYSDSICPGSSEGFINLNPSGGTPPFSYSWSNGGTTQNISGISAGNYNVTVTDDNRCENLQEFAINSTVPYGDEKICIVTIDLISGKNIIVWEKTSDKSITTYNIYREFDIGQFTFIGSRDVDDLSIFRDETANPESRSYLYKITVTDTCRNESSLESTPYHWPSFLQYVSSVGGINLSWTDYKIEGIDNVGDYLSSYVIYRGTDSTGLSEYQVVGRQLHFTDKDPDALVRKYYYRVVGILKDPCYPTASSGKKDEPGPYNYSMSNIEDNRISTGLPDDINAETLSIYPNPFSEHTILTFNNPDRHAYNLYIMDLSGKVCRIVNNINTSRYVIEKGDLQEGFYIIELRGPQLYRERIIVE